MLLLNNHYKPETVQYMFQTGKPATPNVTLAEISRNYTFSNCRISHVCYGSKNIPTYLHSRTNPDTDVHAIFNKYAFLEGFFHLRKMSVLWVNSAR